MFDSDSDGVISATKVDLNTLSTELLEVFSPLLCEMEELSTTLDREEFLDAALRLYSTLNVNDRNLILQFRKVPKDNSRFTDPDCTFQPQINSKGGRME